jgi:hypothetical protein
MGSVSGCQISTGRMAEEGWSLLWGSALRGRGGGGIRRRNKQRENHSSWKTWALLFGDSRERKDSLVIDLQLQQPCKVRAKEMARKR